MTKELEERVRRADEAHFAARATGQVVPHQITRESAEARLALHRARIGEHTFDAAMAFGTFVITDRARRLVALCEGSRDWHGRERMFVVSEEQLAEIKATGTTSSPVVHEPAPTF